jgi:hypothetical protein
MERSFSSFQSTRFCLPSADAQWSDNARQSIAVQKAFIYRILGDAIGGLEVGRAFAAQRLSSEFLPESNVRHFDSTPEFSLVCL